MGKSTEWMRRYRAEYREEYNQKMQQYRAKHPEQIKRIQHKADMKRDERRKAPVGKCIICHGEGKLFRDHDHSTGKFRGYICSKCNTAIGMAHDSPDILQAMVSYLKTRGKPTVYLAGGIAGLEPDEVVRRFTEGHKKLESIGFKVLNPIRGKVMDVEVDQRYEPNEIVDRDERDIDNADIIIAMPSEKSIGTFMEIYKASTINHIPVIVVSTSRHITNHYWIRAKATKILPTLDDAIEYINRWYMDFPNSGEMPKRGQVIHG